LLQLKTLHIISYRLGTLASGQGSPRIESFTNEESEGMVRTLMKTFLTFAAILVSVALFSQTQPAPKQPAAAQPQQPQTQGAKENPADKYSEADRPEENYLERFHALDICEKLQVENIELIRVLNVITTNFKSSHSDWEGDFKGIYDGYKAATSLYYQRNIIYARVKYEENKTAILKFYKKISDAYKKDCEDLMNKCADTLLERTLGGAGKGTDTSVRRASSEENKALFRNKMRVRIAYGQMADAERAVEDGLPQSSVMHYRIAKGYAIRILEELDAENSLGKYDLMKADNLNRIMTAKKTEPAVQPK
jgi:hypothetical protein